MNDGGGLVSRTRYYPHGNVWTQEFSGASAVPTDRLFTGQRRYGQKSGILHRRTGLLLRGEVLQR